MGTTGLLQRASEIYREKGVISLLKNGYSHFAPSPINFRYGAVNTIRYPQLLAGHIRKQILLQANQLYHSIAYPIDEGTNVMDQDWDNLIILDACRTDFFQRHHGFDGEYDEITSIGGRSPTFMKRTFEGETYHDTVYVSANMHTVSYQDGVFHDVINVWEDEWATEFGAVLPESVTEAALEAAEQYPDKRIMVHYMQPHTPYLGEKADQLRNSAEWEFVKSVSSREDPNFLPALWNNALSISDEELHEMYAETLDIVLQDVEELVEEIEGKTVISADHGELLGEGIGPVTIKSYGHPPLYVDELRTVPWYTVAGYERRETVAEEPVSQADVDTQEAERQLEALGYLN